jgi:hypothetical protein
LFAERIWIVSEDDAVGEEEGRHGS